MSIDHGKVLALADEIRQHIAWRERRVDRLASPSIAEMREWEAAFRVLARPAEAVEGADGVPFCPTCGAFPGESQRHDAAQGAVAYRWVRNGEPVGRWIDGKPSPNEFEAAEHCKQLAEWTVEYAYTHPQAAPAQGASLRHTNVHLNKESVERNIRSSSALEGISTKTFQAASAGDEE